MNVFDRYELSCKYFGKSEKYREVMEKMNSYAERGEFGSVLILLDELPGEDDLYRTLAEKLKTKSVGRTIKKIGERKGLSKSLCLKGLTSLMTHVVIEAEKNPEYGILLPKLYEKIGELLYRKD